LIKHLKKTEERSRPASKEKLLTWIGAHTPAHANGATPEIILEKLEQGKLIKVSDAGIAYEL
jgi:hypothetical protein